MSGDAASLPCPLCLNSGYFNTVQSLRDRLISVSTSKMICPVCQEEVFGLDKLTIHLFSHVKLKNLNEEYKNEKGFCPNFTPVQSTTGPTMKKKNKQPALKNKTPVNTSNEPLKYVKIYPKLPTVPQNHNETCHKIKEEFCNSPQVSKTELASTNKEYVCNECNLQFVDNHILKMHKCLIHNETDVNTQDSSGFKCHICPKNFKMRGSLMVHLRVAHFGFAPVGENIDIIRNNSDNATPSKNDPSALTIDKADNKQWQCDVCRKSFTTKYFLKKHKRLHTGETPYACLQCNKTFTFQQSYHKHLLYHNDEKPHTCNYCGRAFKELSTLHNHQRIHTGEKPFTCETCGKCFRQRVSYLVHRRIHTGVMPYKCTACNKSFRYKVSQRTHKCQAQPPGTVIRQAGELLEKLKKKQSTPNEVINSKYLEVSEASAELVRTGAQLSLEDTVTENFTLIPETFENKGLDNTILNNDTNSKAVSKNSSTLDKNVPSPSEIMKNLCIAAEDNFSHLDNSENQDNLTNFDLFNEFSVFL